MNNQNNVFAFDIDGVFLSDVNDYTYDMKLSDAISCRLLPIFQVPSNIPYYIITSRNTTESYDTYQRFIQKLQHQPKKIFHDCDWDHEDRYDYKARILHQHPEIIKFFESELETIEYLLQHGIDSNRLIHWDNFIQNSLLNYYDRSIKNGNEN